MNCSAPECDQPQRPSGRYCREHHNAYMREWRAAGHEHLSEFQKQQARTRSYTHVLVSRGKLAVLPCRECAGTENVEAHHPDYSDPRRVVWLCRTHHKALHTGLGSVTELTRTST